MSADTREHVEAAWRFAAALLTIRFECIPIQLPQWAEAFAVGYIPDFGGTKGMLLFLLDGPHELSSIAKENGFYCSFMSYTSYERALFTDALNDWGYFGPADRKPPWYEGLDYSR